MRKNETNVKENERPKVVQAVRTFKPLAKWNDLLDGILFLAKDSKRVWLGLAVVSVILGFVGLLRLLMEYIVFEFLKFNYGFTIRQGFDFYVLRPDIIFTMFFFVIYLCFFSAPIIHWMSAKLGGKVNFSKLLKILITLQFVHFLVPLGDYVGVGFLNMPVRYIFLPVESINYGISPGAYLSPGILFGWAVAAIVTTWFLVKTYKLSLLKAVIIDAFVFVLIFWPTYMFPVLFNTIFDAIVGIECIVIGGGMCLHQGVYYGYALFFLIAALWGLYHSHKYLMKERGAK